MTSSSAHQSGTVPRETSNGSAEPLGPPSDAVTLNDLIADSGPLPADAALECVQRLATLLDGHPDIDCNSLSPSDVLIDDDGEVWLTRKSTGSGVDAITETHPARLDRLGRLLAFLATGENAHLSNSFILESTSSPSRIATTASEHFARNGVCYQSYADLAREAAGLHEPTTPKTFLPANDDTAVEPSRELPEPVTSSDSVAINPPENTLDDDDHQATESSTVASKVADESPPETVRPDAEPVLDEPPHSADVEPVTAESCDDGALAVTAVTEAADPIGPEEAFAVTPREAPAESSWLGIGVAVAAAAGAAIAYVVWQFL